MLVSLTYEPNDAAVDAGVVFGHLLFKHPEKVQQFDSSVGTSTVFYPEASAERCTVSLVLDVDPVALVRNKRFRGDSGELSHYINDRPYVASSMLAQALGQVFRTAMTGRSDSYPAFADAALPLRIELPVVSARGDDDLIERMFVPCGWQVDAQPLPLDPDHPEWGASRYSAVTLTGSVQLALALRQLYVLLPVLDDSKHYWVTEDEVAKLERNGEGWLAEHPERALITERYLVHQRSLTAQVADESEVNPDGEKPLKVLRADAVIQALKDVGAHTVVDMGCGPGALLVRLNDDQFFTKIVGVDVSARSLDRAEQRLRLYEASDAQRQRVELMHGSVLYRDDRLRGYDAMVLMEVIEHVELARLDALQDAVFAGAAPNAVIVTTPNVEYNALYEGLMAGKHRHDDHRFEWTRAEFAEWTSRMCQQYGYTVEHRDVGPRDEVSGAPTQLAIFRKVVSA